MPEYKITKVSSDEPRTWVGPHGTIYYHKVMVDDHNKPISVGKKKPNSLSVGDILTGDITFKEGAEDGFKAAPMQTQGAPRAQEKQFKADPLRQASIEWQASLKAAIETVRDFYTLTMKIETKKIDTYRDEIIEVAKIFAKIIEEKPEVVEELPEGITDFGEDDIRDFSDDEAQTIDLDEIPF